MIWTDAYWARHKNCFLNVGCHESLFIWHDDSLTLNQKLFLFLFALLSVISNDIHIDWKG